MASITLIPDLSTWIQGNDTATRATIGLPGFNETTAAADKVAQAAAQAGATPDQQQAARAEYLAQIQAGADNFDLNSGASNLVQRFTDWIAGTTQGANVLAPDLPNLNINLPGLGDAANAISSFSTLALVAIALVVIFMVWYVVKEVL